MTKLVLLPGMDGTSELFAPFVAALPTEFEPITIRFPGDRFLSYAELEVLLRSSCPESEPFLLLAESFSTPLAIQYAAKHPAFLKALILSSGFAASPVRNWHWLISLFAPLSFRSRIPRFAIRHWLVGPDAPSSLVSKVQAAISSVRPEVLSRRLCAVIKCDVRSAACEIAVPVLYLRANQDRLISEKSLAEIQRIKPDISVTLIDGPHLILQSKPLQAVAEVVTFFNRVKASAGN